MRETAVFVSLLAALSVFAEGEVAVDPQLDAEIAYIEALVNRGYPDIAAPVIERTKKAWPESEAQLFAIEIRSMLSLGQLEAAEKKIGALPDRKSTKFWAARLEVANNYYVRNQKKECTAIYDEFFKVFPTPPKDIYRFHTQAGYSYGQLLADDKQYAKAAARYETIFKQMNRGEDDWCNLGCETANLYLKMAEIADSEKEQKQRAEYLDAATKVVDQLLWQLDKPVYFGRALSMKAHIEQLKGDVMKAAELIEEYKPQLKELHESIIAIDPEGREGLLRQSPLPECVYLQAKMLWEEAEKEYRKQSRDDEKIKSLLFGPKGADGKRKVAKGAFAMAQGVFLNYDRSSWAVAAGELAEEIKTFAEEKYNAKIKTKVTPEQIAKMRAAQFREANELFMGEKYKEAIEAYTAILAKNPESEESVLAVENMAIAYFELEQAEKNAAIKAEYQLNTEVIAGYLAERFAGARNRIVMSAGGDAATRVAARIAEVSRARGNRIYTEIVKNYVDHPNSAAVAAGRGGEAAKAGRFKEAMKFWQLIGESYTNSPYYAVSLHQMSFCNGKLGNSEAEIDYIKQYIEVEPLKLRRIQAQMSLAQMYLNGGKIKEAIEQFVKFDGEAAAAIKDPSTPKNDLPKYKELKESAMFIVGECWSRIKEPEEELAGYRRNAAAAYERYLKEYPTGKYAKAGYVKLGTIYTALGDVDGSRKALDQLSKRYPDSDEARNAKPRLAKNLIEMGMKREGADIYAEMLKTDGAYTANQFIAAGESLVEAKDFELANRAFEKAITLAGGTNLYVIGKARLGEARGAFKQGSLSEAREALDKFLKDPKLVKLAIAADAHFMLVEVASEQGRAEKDETLRGKYFGAAVGSLKKVKAYWAKKPLWEQNRLELLSGDVLVNRMEAEESMGLKEAAAETCGRAAASFQVFIQAHGPSPETPFDKMGSEDLANLEEAYSKLVGLFARMGAGQADRVVKFGGEYLELFPEGAARTDVINCINQAKADLPSGGAAMQPSGN